MKPDFEKDVLWCEECEYFGHADMGGEGACDFDGHDTWYGCPACKIFSPKDVADKEKLK